MLWTRAACNLESDRDATEAMEYAKTPPKLTAIPSAKLAAITILKPTRAEIKRLSGDIYTRSQPVNFSIRLNAPTVK